MRLTKVWVIVLAGFIIINLKIFWDHSIKFSLHVDLTSYTARLWETNEKFDKRIISRIFKLEQSCPIFCEVILDLTIILSCEALILCSYIDLETINRALFSRQAIVFVTFFFGATLSTLSRANHATCSGWHHIMVSKSMIPLYANDVLIVYR